MLYGVSNPTAQANYSHVERDSSQRGATARHRLCLFPASYLTCQLRIAPASRFTVRTACGELSRAQRSLSRLGRSKH